MIVSIVWGISTSLRMLARPMPIVDPTASRFSFALPSELYAIRYGEAKKCTRFTRTRMANVPYRTEPLKNST